jgi:hypothetical protein
MGARTLAIGVAFAVALGLLVAAVNRRDRAQPLDQRATTTSSASVAGETAELLPNLLSLDATQLEIEPMGDRRRLRFAGTLANSGPGPLELLPRGRGRCAPGEHAAQQLLYVDTSGDGRFQRSRDAQERRAFAGCMLRHRGHDHWHFDAMASYRLRLPGSDDALAHRPKVSFCLRDNERLEGVVGPPREHFGECSATGVQGISPGWVDVYGPDLDGQWLALPRTFTSGLVCLDLAADPRDLVLETDESDNATTTAVRIRGDRARVVSTTRCQ